MKKHSYLYLYQLLKRRLNEVRDNPKLVLYYIQGHVNWFIHGRAIVKFKKKELECPECFSKGQCVNCGCDFSKLALSNKPCGKIQ